MSALIADLRVETEADVFSARREVRDVAAQLGFDTTDQVRIASAVSDWGRVLVSGAFAAELVLELRSPPPALVVRIAADDVAGFAAVRTDNPAVHSSGRLMDAIDLGGEPGTVELAKRLPPGADPSGQQLAALRERYALPVRTALLEDLQAQNDELLATLEALKQKHDELGRINDELQETNRGVMAMYAQLSGELEETNRGVVALYAELDERGAQLRDANNAKSRFLASVSHELRGPLNSIVALTKLLRAADSDPLTTEQDNQLRLVESAAAQLRGLVDDLLDLAKAEAGQLQPDNTDVDVAALITDLCTSLRPITPDGVRLAARVPGDLPPLHTDPVLLGQVLRNLLSNALRFTEQGQVSLIVTRPAAGLVGFAVADTGVGIAAENHELVFEEFFQVPGPLQLRSKGTGLGLPYARRVVATLGGSLALSSAPGVGSTFSFRIPEQPGEAPPAPELPRLGTVLVVDDELEFRHVMRALLGGAAERVLEADGAGSALRQLEAFAADLVLLDLRMPGGDGEQLLAEMDGRAALRDVPVVVITSAPGAAERPSSSAGWPVLDKAELTSASLARAVDAALRGRVA